MEEQAQRKPRRRMAYAAVSGILGSVVAAFIVPVAQPNADIISTGIYVMGAGWLTYMGVQVAPDIVAAFKR